MRFTVYLMTHQYERWDTVAAPSQEALRRRLEDEGTEWLGSSDMQDTTWYEIEIEHQDDTGLSHEEREEWHEWEREEEEDDTENG